MRLAFMFIYCLLFISCSGSKNVQTPSSNLAKIPGSENSGGGGNAYVAEFYSLLQKSLDKWRGQEHLVVRDTSIKLSLLRERLTVNRTFIASTNEILLLNQVEVHAINYPKQNKIIFNEGAWKKFSIRQKLLLVFHEMLGIIQSDLFVKDTKDNNYEYSSAIVDALEAITAEDVLLTFASMGMPINTQVKVVKRWEVGINEITQYKEYGFLVCRGSLLRVCSRIVQYHVLFNQKTGEIEQIVKQYLDVLTEQSLLHEHNQSFKRQ